MLLIWLRHWKPSGEQLDQPILSVSGFEKRSSRDQVFKGRTSDVRAHSNHGLAFRWKPAFSALILSLRLHTRRL